MFILGGIIVGISYCILSLLGTLPQLAMYVALSIDMFVLGVGALFLNFPLQIIMIKSVQENIYQELLLYLMQEHYVQHQWYHV